MVYYQTFTKQACDQNAYFGLMIFLKYSCMVDIWADKDSVPKFLRLSTRASLAQEGNQSFSNKKKKHVSSPVSLNVAVPRVVNKVN